MRSIILDMFRLKGIEGRGMDKNVGKNRVVILGKKGEVIAAMRERAGLDETGTKKLLNF